MKIIISPAKKMNVDTDTFAWEELPPFLDDTGKLMEWVQGLSFEEAGKLWGCNEKLTALNYGRFQSMDLRKNLTPALLAYEGIQYQYMAPGVFSREEWDYVQKHLRILSGFYGVLKPLDGVVPYRLEMQAKVKVQGVKDLYDFWQDRIYKQVMDRDHRVVNLASKEYYKCIEAYVQPQDEIITCIFGEEKDGRVIQKGTQAKMARGEMVRFMAERHVQEFGELKAFDRLGYRFCEELSTDKEYIYTLKVPDGGCADGQACLRRCTDIGNYES